MSKIGNKHCLGKKNALKLKTPELKKDAYDQYCDWIASGKSKKSWHFEHPDLTLTWETMEKYIRSDSGNFDPIKKEIAKSKSLEVWEQRGMDMMMGVVKKCEPALYQMFMRNKFGWDREKTAVEDSTKPLIQEFAEALRLKNITRKEE